MNISLRTFLPLCLVVFLNFLSNDLLAQANEKAMLSIGSSYTYYIPGGDLSERFGDFNALTLTPQVELKERNWLLLAEGQFLFGNNVIEPNLLSNLKSENGEVLDEDALPAQILYFTRGYSLSLGLGKRIYLEEDEKGFGLSFALNAGFLQHKIRIEHQNNRIPQLEGEYEKGYDRLCNGLMLTQKIGLFYTGRMYANNMKLELIFNQGFTQDRRDFNFDERRKLDEKRLDLFSGLRFTWLLPIKRRIDDNFYIN